MKATLFRSIRSLSALLPGLALLTLLAGCSSLPKTAALNPAEQQSALSRLHDFASAMPSSSVDTGYDLAWDIMGQSGKTEAQLQMEAPDMLRFSALDPLGRLLYLAVADGQNFTLVDNRAATVQRGAVNGPLWRKHVHEPLAISSLMPLLGGRVEKLPAYGIRAEQNPEKSGYWFFWKEGGLNHHLLLDKKSGLVARHILAKDRGGILLDLRYTGYDRDRKTGYFWPKLTEVEGRLVRGTLTLKRSGRLSFDPLPLSTFHPEIPSHFKEESLR